MAQDPMLNERLILAQLRDEQASVTPNFMRTLCSLVLMSAWDRKVEREFFAGLLDDVAMINIDLSDLESLGRLRQLLVAHEDDTTPLDERSQTLVAGFMARRKSFATKMDLISQCPKSADSIH